jgi:hypothetical protein
MVGAVGIEHEPTFLSPANSIPGGLPSRPTRARGLKLFDLYADGATTQSEGEPWLDD